MDGMYALEAQCREAGFSVPCGIDEAGRGPLAGPVYAAAVVLSPDTRIAGVNDSKKLTPKKREALFDEICKSAASYSIAFASVEEIESLNILNAAMLAMRRAFDGLSVRSDIALIDGNTVRYFDGIEARSIVHGDASCAAIAAASILAKVSRDRYMTEQAQLWPGYGFERNKGYGTKEHTDALLRLGPCPIHRMSFLRKISGGKK